MLEYASFLGSAGALIVAVVQAALLARGAPPTERRMWLAIAAALTIATLQRLNLGIRSMLGEGIALPASASVTIMIIPIVAAFVFWRIRPILQGYRAADRAREASDERFRRALADSRDPVAIVDATGRYTYVNDAGCEFFRYPREAILGRHARDFIVASDANQSSIELAFASGAAHIEREVLRGDGTRIPVECDLIALGDGSVLIIGRDLTTRHEAETARVRVQRLEAVSTLAAGIAHDFNNLLSVIRVTLGLASERSGERVPLDGAIRATERASVLTQELIEFARAAIERAGRPEPSTIDIAPVVAEAARLVAMGLDNRIRVQLQDAPGAVPVRAYAADVDRICMNLLVNARDAVAESIDSALADGNAATTSGRIEITVRRTNTDTDTSGNRGPEAEIVVCDTGPGIADVMRDQIFEPFVSTKGERSGHGLGLAATRELVLNLGGSITVDSHPGEGTTFTVRLPLAHDPGRTRDEASVTA